MLGTSLLHSGVVINNREYAFGGHETSGVTGVYVSKPRSPVPGATFRAEIIQGFTLLTTSEIEQVIKDVSKEWEGTSYNLLTKNCNHFTSQLCERLTGRPSPRWLNRAASIGHALPCVVPRDWVEPPDHDTAEGELLVNDEEGLENTERSRMLRRSESEQIFHDNSATDGVIEYSTDDDDWDSEEERRRGGTGKGKGKAKATDSSGRIMPIAERAPES